MSQREEESPAAQVRLTDAAATQPDSHAADCPQPSPIKTEPRDLAVMRAG